MKTYKVYSPLMPDPELCAYLVAGSSFSARKAYAAVMGHGLPISECVASPVLAVPTGPVVYHENEAIIARTSADHVDTKVDWCAFRRIEKRHAAFARHNRFALVGRGER